MLAKNVREDYFNTEVEDFNWVKDLSFNELYKLVSHEMDYVGFKFKTKPYKHQLVSFFIGLCRTRWLFCLDMGLGKSKITLDLVQYYKKKDSNGRCLVVVPNDVNLEGWVEQIQEHSYLTYYLMTGTSKERMNALFNVDKDVFVITYPALYYLCGKKIKDKKGIKVDLNKIKKIAKFFDFLIIDEIHYSKNKESLTYKVLDRLSDRVKYVYGCTGTPFGRDPIDLWAQFHLVDKGETFGNTIGFYREMFFIKGSGFGGRAVYNFDERLSDELHYKMGKSSIRYRDDECQDLPKKKELIKKVLFSEEAYSYYQPAAESFRQALIEKDYNSTELSFHKLRELCAGFISIKDEEENKIIIEFDNPPKIKMLESLLNEIPKDSKVVIFHFFIPSGRLIEKLLMSMNIKYSTVRGETVDKIEQITRFKDKDNDTQVLVANTKSASAGGNFQVANYLIFYDPPISPITRKQCVKRVYRGGQKKSVTIVDLIVGGSVEEKIFSYVSEGENLFNYIMNGDISFDSIRTPLIGDV